MISSNEDSKTDTDIMSSLEGMEEAGKKWEEDITQIEQLQVQELRGLSAQIREGFDKVAATRKQLDKVAATRKQLEELRKDIRSIPKVPTLSPPEEKQKQRSHRTEGFVVGFVFLVAAVVLILLAFLATGSGCKITHTDDEYTQPAPKANQRSAEWNNG